MFIILSLLFAVIGISNLFLPGHQFIGLMLLFIAALCLLAKWQKKLAGILALMSLVLFTALEIPILSASKTNAPKNVDVVVVLGCAVYGESPSWPMVERVDAAFAYLEENPDTLCIVSGGQGDGEAISEAECMRRLLVNKGIDPERIYLEDKSTSTKENIAYSYSIIEQILPNSKSQDGSFSVAFVSSEYHLFRTRFLARMQDHDIYLIAAKTTRLVLRVNYFIREAPAMLKALVVH